MQRPTPIIDTPTIDRPLIQNNHWRLDELNMRISSRDFPDMIIPQSITPRPIETRQTILGKSTDPRNTVSVTKIVAYPPSHSSNSHNFIPSDRGEPNWFLANVDTETILRNQCFALQKGGVAPQATFIPASDSELYRDIMPINSSPVEQPFPRLFEVAQFNPNMRHSYVKGVGYDYRNGYIAQSGGTTNGAFNGHQNARVFYNIDRANLSNM